MLKSPPPFLHLIYDSELSLLKVFIVTSDHVWVTKATVGGTKIFCAAVQGQPQCITQPRPQLLQRMANKVRGNI